MKAPFRSAKTAVIAELLQNDRLSRLELSERTSVSPAAITEVTQELLRQKLLLETMPSVSTEKRRGRPTVQLSLAGSHSCFVGVSMSEGKNLLAITDLHGHVLHCCELGRCSTPGEAVRAVRQHYRASLRQAGVKPDCVRGIGVTVAGIVDAESGVCRYSAGLDWRDVPISEMIHAAVGLPVWVDNDANAIAMGQKIFGRARAYENFSSIVLGRNIGSAHYMHGSLYRGADGSAGEIGHVTIEPDGRLCRCGRQGCLDTIAGGSALRQVARECGLEITGVRDLEEFAIQGNSQAIRLLREAGKALGAAVATLVHLNNPKAVLFNDIEGFKNGVFRTATRQMIENSILPRLLGTTEVLFIDAEAASLPRSAASIAAFNYLISL